MVHAHFEHRPRPPGERTLVLTPALDEMPQQLHVWLHTPAQHHARKTMTSRIARRTATPAPVANTRAMQGKTEQTRCMAPKNRATPHQWSVHPRSQSMSATMTAHGPATGIAPKIDRICCLHSERAGALRPLLAQTRCCCASDSQSTTALRCQRHAFHVVFLRLVNELQSKNAFFCDVSSFAYWRRVIVALHFALPTGSADPTPPTNTEYITYGKNRR